MVWYQVRTYGGAGCIVVMVLLLHLLFLLAWTLYKPVMRSMHHEPAEKYTLVSLAPEPVASPFEPVTAPEPELQIQIAEADQTPFASIMPQQQNAVHKKGNLDSPKREPCKDNSSDNNSIENKEKGRESAFIPIAADMSEEMLQETITKEDAPDNAKTAIVEQKREKEISAASEKSKPETVTPPPNVVLDDDIPIPFLGVNTNHVSDKDSEFHRFIKLVNKALYASMQMVPQPISSLPRPIAVRMVIVRTGRLAQMPTVIHSSGDPIRDQWYITMIERASASFPPIPMSLRIPFIELAFREGMDRASPYR